MSEHMSVYCNTSKIDNSLVYQILSMIFMDIDVYVYMKQRKSTQNGQGVYFKLHKSFLSQSGMHATELEKKLQNSHYDSEKKGWD